MHEIREKALIPLGYGKYVRSDKVIAVEPVEDGRGSGRRSLVYVEGMDRPLVSTHTEETVYRYLTDPHATVVRERAVEEIRFLEGKLRSAASQGREAVLKATGLDLLAVADRLQAFLDEELPAVSEEPSLFD